MRFFLRNRAGIIVSILGIIIAVWMSSEADRRQGELIAFERQWKVDEKRWFDSTIAQAARNEQLLQAMLDTLQRMHADALAQRTQQLEALKTKQEAHRPQWPKNEPTTP